MIISIISVSHLLYHCCHVIHLKHTFFCLCCSQVTQYGIFQWESTTEYSRLWWCRWTFSLQHLHGALWWQYPPGQVPLLLPHILLFLSHWILQKARKPRCYPVPKMSPSYTTAVNGCSWSAEKLLHWEYEGNFQENWATDQEQLSDTWKQAVVFLWQLQKSHM